MQYATIAAHTVGLCGCERLLHADKLSRFASDGSPVRQTITVVSADVLDVPTGHTTGTHRHTAWITAAHGGVLFHRDGLFRLDYTADFSQCTLTLRNGVKDSEVLQYLYTVQCFAYHLLATDGCLVHSAAVASAKGAVLLCGASGVGKSTVATHCLAHDPTLTVLCEDMPALRMTEKGTHVYGTPFCGQDTRCAAGSAPLSAIVLLQQGEHNRLARAHPADAFGTLLSCIPAPVYAPPLQERAVASAQTLCETQEIWLFENNGTAEAARYFLKEATENGWL